jgi:3-deoxy-D-arabino-heptulosonate 7-phosphate (DAHP) synthase class II
MTIKNDDAFVDSIMAELESFLTANIAAWLAVAWQHSRLTGSEAVDGWGSIERTQQVGVTDRPRSGHQRLTVRSYYSQGLLDKVRW